MVGTGPVVYALSAIEIALWDIAGKLASLPIASLLGGAPRELTAYASLLRYAEPELVASAVERALSQGFRHIKLHEVRLDTVAAARAACGESVWLALDTNCPWSVSQSIEHARALEASRLAWLEEPVWPPEDHAGLARVRAATTLPIAAGENAAGVHDLAAMLRAGSIDICQPSVIKIRRHRGGGTGGDLGARAWRRLRAALFLLWTGLSGVASPRCGVRAGGRLRALLRRPASQPVSRRRARSPGPTVSAARARAGTRSGHGGTQSLPPRPPGRDRKLNAEPYIFTIDPGPWSTV